MRAISAKVGSGSIQCSDWEQVTMSAQASGRSVAVEVPALYRTVLTSDG